ncbi:MAG: hypothetical protein IJ700_08420 [Bacteroidaceae bacterium]|nr:hypothetical protein [Bacteroidaceae bacterium]
MEKKAYIEPVLQVTPITLESHLMQNSVGSVTGLDGVEKGEGDFGGGASDTKSSDWNIWDE